MSHSVKWFRHLRDKKKSVQWEMLLLKAKEYAEVCNCKNPKNLSISWINQWKVRMDIACKKRHGAAEYADQ